MSSLALVDFLANNWQYCILDLYWNIDILQLELLSAQYLFVGHMEEVELDKADPSTS